MTSEIAAQILRDQQAMETQRSQFDITNQRIAELIRPASAQFISRDLIQGQRKDQFQFDSTAALALLKFSSACESILIPRTQRWHALEADDENLKKRPAVRRFCEEWTNILFRARYAARAGFTYASGETLEEVGAFGSGCIFLDEDVGRDLRYRSLSASELWFAPDFSGRIDRVHRKFSLSARAAKQKFGDKLPKQIAIAAEKSPDAEFEFIHCVKPQDDYDPGRRDYRGMRFGSYYVAMCGQDVIDRGGYRTMPYLTTRFRTAARETYGRGPASMVLPTMNTVNEQQKTLLRAGQRAVDPPIMMVDDDALETFNLRAGSLNRGYLSANGEALAVPFNQNANLPIGIEFVQDSREVINDAFFVTLFQVLVDNPQQTATEALLRAQEKGDLLGPSVGRQQEEWLDPQIARELDILGRIPGLGPEMPPELEEAGGLMAVRYTSPLNRMQRSGDGAAMLRWLETMSVIEQVKPGTIAQTADLSKFARELADIQGVPESVLLDEQAQVDEADAQAEMEQAQMMLAAAPVAGKTALDFAKAQQLANAQPSAATLL